MLSKTQVQLLPLTSETLSTFRQAIPMPGERLINQTRIKRLMTLIRTGQFVELNWARGLCRTDQQWYRFDGQHTAHLLADVLNNEPTAFPVNTPITLVDWEFESIEADGAAIFELYNHPWSVRTNTDAMANARAAFPDLLDLDPAFLIKVVNGISFYQKQETKTKKKAEDAPTLFQIDARHAGLRFTDPLNRAFALWVYQFRDVRLAKKLLGRNGVMGAIYSDWLDDQILAEKFWLETLHESAPDPDDDTRLFAEALKKLNSKNVRIPAGTFYREATRAWKRYKQVSSRLAA